ncbi:MAG: hypothetical protein J0H32_03900 [Rhizobiales bacterium]|nr:hypothetical protein [Hyphomicrobiales bacterium]
MSRIAATTITIIAGGDRPGRSTENRPARAGLFFYGPLRAAPVAASDLRQSKAVGGRFMRPASVISDAPTMAHRLARDVGRYKIIGICRRFLFVVSVPFQRSQEFLHGVE